MNASIYIFNILFVVVLSYLLASKYIHLFAPVRIFIKCQRLVIALSPHDYSIYRVIEFCITIIIICEKPINAPTFSCNVAVKTRSDKQLYLSHIRLLLLQKLIMLQFLCITKYTQIGSNTN